MPRRASLAVVLAVLAATCTGGSGSFSSPPATTGSPTTSASSPAASPTARPITLEVVAGLSGPGADQGYVDGMKLALDEVNERGGIGGRPMALAVQDHGGSRTEATNLIRDIVTRRSGRPPAILYAGTGPALSPLRAQIEQAGTPVVLLEGDLYTSRGLFRQVFQTTIPWEWQAHVIARYLDVDRKARDVVFVGVGPEARAGQRSLRDALAYWGGKLASGFIVGSIDDRSALSRAFDRAAKADAAVVFGPPSAPQMLAASIEDLAPEPGLRPRISGPASLLGDTRALATPGWTACYTYTWAGWADPIPRVGRFRARFRAAFGRDPARLEQEGYDAVRLLAEALTRTGGRGGSKLTAALEGTRNRTFSSFPIDLGPDDHLFLPRDELGLFAVAGPDERVDPWQAPGSRPWRALMRTFTYDGERTNVLDRDRRVFFPSWRENRPGPKFFRSRYGIRSRASRDPLH